MAQSDCNQQKKKREILLQFLPGAAGEWKLSSSWSCRVDAQRGGEEQSWPQIPKPLINPHLAGMKSQNSHHHQPKQHQPYTHLAPSLFWDKNNARSLLSLSGSAQGTPRRAHSQHSCPKHWSPPRYGCRIGASCPSELPITWHTQEHGWALTSCCFPHLVASLTITAP